MSKKQSSMAVTAQELKVKRTVDPVAEVRKRLPNAPDDEWVRKYCPIEIEFAERMLWAEIRAEEAEKRVEIYANLYSESLVPGK